MKSMITEAWGRDRFLLEHSYCCKGILKIAARVPLVAQWGRDLGWLPLCHRFNPMGTCTCHQCSQKKKKKKISGLEVMAKTGNEGCVWVTE